MKLFNLKQKNKARGFTLIELLIVVGFIALGSIGVYIVYDKVTTGNAANTESRNIDTLRAGIKSIYAGQVNYDNITETVLLNARVVPDNMRNTAGTAVINSFGGSVTVAAATFGTGAQANNAFVITYPNVPSNVCAKLVAGAGNSFNRVRVGNTSVKDTSTSTGNVLNVVAMAEACNSSNAGVTIEFLSI